MCRPLCNIALAFLLSHWLMATTNFSHSTHLILSGQLEIVTLSLCYSHYQKENLNCTVKRRIALRVNFLHLNYM